jgi:hypothetical protein
MNLKQVGVSVDWIHAARDTQQRLGAVLNTVGKNYLVSGLCPSFGILDN